MKRTQYALAMFAVNAARVAGVAKPNMATGTAEEDVLDYVVPAADIRRLRLSLEHLDAESSEADLPELQAGRDWDVRRCAWLHAMRVAVGA